MLNKKKIIIIDDEPHILKLTVFLLNEAGFEVKTANNGLQGLNLIKKEIPDLILLDLNIPEMDGHEICSLLKADEILKKIPVITLTASSEKIKEKCEAIGADDYIIKPYEAQELLAKVKKFCHEKKRYSDLNNKNESLTGKNFIVNVYNKIMEFIPGFLKDKKNDIKKLQDALQNSAYEEIQKIGHMLRGVGILYGFDFISEVGKDLEFAVKEKKFEKISEKIKELQNYLDNVKVKYI